MTDPNSTWINITENEDYIRVQIFDHLNRKIHLDEEVLSIKDVPTLIPQDHTLKLAVIDVTVDNVYQAIMYGLNLHLHVLCIKPPILSEAKLDTIYHRIDELGLQFFVYSPSMFNLSINMVNKLITDGDFGIVYDISFESRRNYDPTQFSNYICPHLVSAIEICNRLLQSKPITVFAQGYDQYSSLVTLTYPRGRSINNASKSNISTLVTIKTVRINRKSNNETDRISIFGEKDMYDISFDSDRSYAPYDMHPASLIMDRIIGDIVYDRIDKSTYISILKDYNDKEHLSTLHAIIAAIETTLETGSPITIKQRHL
jgi:predicted dehydrogenase